MLPNRGVVRLIFGSPHGSRRPFRQPAPSPAPAILRVCDREQKDSASLCPPPATGPFQPATRGMIPPSLAGLQR